MRFKLKPKRATLFFDEGGMTEVSFLGKGMFAECWESETGWVYSIVRPAYGIMDYSKDILATVKSHSDHIPFVEFMGTMGNARVYRTHKFHPLLARHKTAWRQFKLLKEADDFATQEWRKNFRWGETPTWNGHCEESNLSVASRIMEQDKVLGESLQELADEACNYVNYKFEFSKANLKVDKHGTLILLDVLYPTDAVDARWKAKKREVR